MMEQPMTPAAEPKPATAVPLRWLAAVICIVYGFAKLNGAQFTVLDSELTKPLSEVSGFWLTWYYFGYSATYGTLIALVQIGGGILLAFPRTSLLGALLLFPAITNIVLIDVLFGIDLGATLVALVLLGCLVAVVAPHAGRLLAAVLLDAPSRHLALRLAALGLVLAGAWGLTWWAANYNNRFPTRIDGIWSVVTETGNETSIPRWKQFFFERNRAHLVVLRGSDGIDEWRHFEIDEQGIVCIWESWLRKGALIMQGSASQDGQLELEWVGAGRRGRLVLQRQSSVRDQWIAPSSSTASP